MTRYPTPLLLLIGWVGLTPNAQADEFHFETFRYGQAAMGMGGAAVGQPFEPEATYYNPAGLALIERGVRFSGALNFFGYDRRIQQGALRDGGLFEPGDLDSTNFLPTPSSSVISGRRGRHAFAFSTFLIGDLDERFSGAQTARIVGDPDFEQARFTRSFTRRDELRLRGLTYAYAHRKTLAFGISAFWLEHRYSAVARRAQVASAPRIPTDLFIDVTTREELRTHGLVLRLGAAWRPDAQTSLGLSCQAPTIPLTGEATYGYTVITSGELQSEDAADRPRYIGEEDTAPARTQLPMHCRVGGAWQANARWRLASDVSVHLPVDYDRFDSTITNREELGAQVTTDLTVNVSVGGEYRIAPRWPWRFGVFTNRTSAPEVPAQPSGLEAPHVDLYGITSSLGYLGDDRSLNLGFEVQYGTGHDVVSESLDSLLDEAGFARVGREEWRVVIFIAGAAAFAKSTAKELIKDMDK